MSDVASYSRQYQWRSWHTIFKELPELSGQLVLDLGSGVGDLAADMSARGAHVLGVDINEAFVTFANERQLQNAEFRVADLRTFHDPRVRADGIWSSFTAAYFPALREIVATWMKHLQPGGWLVLTEVDDLFAHQPLSERTIELLDGYVCESLEQSRYDFRMGRKLSDVLRKLGIDIQKEFVVPDAELSFSGPAPHEVVDAWRDRFERMKLLQDFCGAEFEHVRDEFLSCLSREDHRCTATVRCCIGTLR
jgi:SAM-dependent methyltransferase